MPKQEPALRLRPGRPLLKWFGIATASALIVGTAPAAGQLPTTSPAAPPAGGGSAVVPTVYAIAQGTSPLLDAAALAGASPDAWTPQYRPDVTSDGSARDGEGISRSGGATHISTGRTGLLPGGLALAPPVSSTRITSPFGWRLNPTGPGSYIHIGQDYGVACGTPVRAAEDGTVVQSAWAGHSGQRVRIDHGQGVETAYSHNSLLVAHVGDIVKQGDLLALSGTTGNSTGCHVHFEVYLDGKWVDPARFLPLLPGQQQPVTRDELRQIARSGTAPAPPAQLPAATQPSGHASQHAAATDTTSTVPQRPRPTAPTPPSTPDARRPSPTPAPSTKPAPSTPPAISPSPKPTSTPKPTPTAPPASDPSTPTPEPSGGPTASPTTPVPIDGPTPSPTPTPTPTPSPTPTPTPTPSPTPGVPTSPPAPPTPVPPTLAELCLAYVNEEQAAAPDAGTTAPRPLTADETTLLDAAPRKAVPRADRLPADPTVHDVAGLCAVWFPDGLPDGTRPAGLSQLRAGLPPASRSAHTGEKR